MQVPKELVFEMAAGQRQVLALRRGQRLQLLAGMVELASAPAILPGMLPWPVCVERLSAEEGWLAEEGGYVEIVCCQQARLLCLPPPIGFWHRLKMGWAAFWGQCGSRNCPLALGRMAADCHSGKPSQEL